MIRTGIGGWVFPEWRGGVFYPEGLVQKRELEWASRQLGAIEINGTFHGLQKPESFRKWREATPEDFVFAVKGSRFVTNRKVLASAADSLAKFFGQGLEELGDRLGPVIWQLPATKRFEADDVAAFFALLPRELAGVRLRHAIEAPHESFACAQFVTLAREAGVAIVWLEQEGRVSIADRTADFAYLRCKNLRSEVETGYAPQDIARIARLCRAWETGEAPPSLSYFGQPSESRRAAGDVYAFMINGAKHRAPSAALALAKQVGQ